jgi:hypothetical protein
MNISTYNGSVFDGAAAARALGLVLDRALGSAPIAPDRAAFAADPRWTTPLAAPAMPWGGDGTKAAPIAPDRAAFAADPRWTTPIR